MMDGLTLRMLTPDDEPAFHDAHTVNLPDRKEWELAFHYDQNLSFSVYVQMLDDWTRGRNLPDHFAANTQLFGFVNKRLVGRVSIRHELSTRFLQRYGGHIGYGVLIPERGKGYASAMLREALPHLRQLKIDRALLTCDENNPASQRIIEKNGGIFEGYADGHPDIPKRRYWIDINQNLTPKGPAR